MYVCGSMISLNLTSLFECEMNGMDKDLSVSDYGICLFSVEVLQEFLKKEKIRSKKILEKFQKDKKLYLTTQKEGVWVPVVQIDSEQYVIKLNGYDEPFSDEWEQKLEYDGFNIEIKDSLWISSIGEFYKFDANGFCGDEISYQTYDGVTLYSAFKYDVPSGKYLLGIKGYTRKQPLDCSNPNYGFAFSLVKVEEFDGFKNPRESDDYEFNIGWLTKSKEAMIYWFSEAEGGRKESPAEEKYYPTIELEDGSTPKLVIKFDRKNPTQDKMSDNCRVDYVLHHTKYPVLSSNTEFIICDEIRKGSKKTLQKVGRLVIK